LPGLPWQFHSAEPGKETPWHWQTQQSGIVHPVAFRQSLWRVYERYNRKENNGKENTVNKTEDLLRPRQQTDSSLSLDI
jgi:hypothetical protein